MQLLARHGQHPKTACAEVRLLSTSHHDSRYARSDPLHFGPFLGSQDCCLAMPRKLSRHYGDVGFVTSAPHVAKHRVATRPRLEKRAYNSFCFDFSMLAQFEVGSRRGCRLRAAALGLGTDTSSGQRLGRA